MCNSNLLLAQRCVNGTGDPNQLTARMPSAHSGGDRFRESRLQVGSENDEDGPHLSHQDL